MVQWTNVFDQTLRQLVLHSLTITRPVNILTTTLNMSLLRSGPLQCQRWSS